MHKDFKVNYSSKFYKLHFREALSILELDAKILDYQFNLMFFTDLSPWGLEIPKQQVKASTTNDRSLSDRGSGMFAGHSHNSQIAFK